MIAVNWSGRPYQILGACPYAVSHHMARLSSRCSWQVVGARGAMARRGHGTRCSGPSRLGTDAGRWSLARHPVVSRRSTNILYIRALCVRLYLCVPRACPPAQNVVVARAHRQTVSRGELAYVARHDAAMQISQPDLFTSLRSCVAEDPTDARRADDVRNNFLDTQRETPSRAPQLPEEVINYLLKGRRTRRIIKPDFTTCRARTRRCFRFRGDCGARKLLDYLCMLT